LIEFFGCPKGSRGASPVPQGRLVAMCSVFTGFCLAFKFVARKISEHAALRHLIRRLQHNDLLLLDRGFFSLRGVMAHRAASGPLSDPAFAPDDEARQADLSPRS